MPRVRITKTVSLKCTEGHSVLYKAGWEGLVPDAHIERLVKAGAGARLTSRKPRRVESEKLDAAAGLTADAGNGASQSGDRSSDQ